MQQQQHMAGGMGGVRPPPPEYKAAQAQMMHAGIGMGQQARFPNAGPMRRVTQQPMPPSGEYIALRVVVTLHFHATPKCSCK